MPDNIRTLICPSFSKQFLGVAPGTFEGLLEMNGRFFRVIKTVDLPSVQAALCSKQWQKFQKKGQVVSMRLLSLEEQKPVLEGLQDHFGQANLESAAVIEYLQVPFLSLPQEWTGEMVVEAGRLVLDVAEKMLKDGLSLKAVSPYHVVFDGMRPVYMEVTLFERRHLHRASWQAFPQFVKTFINPLLAYRYLKVPLASSFQRAQQGIEPEELYAKCGSVRRWIQPVFSTVTVPTLMKRFWTKRSGNPDKGYMKAEEKTARFVQTMLIRHLRHTLMRSAPSGSRIFRPFPVKHLYLMQKRSYVSDCLQRIKPMTILQMGCCCRVVQNKARKIDAAVVAIDSEPSAVRKIWLVTKAEEANHTTLIVKFSEMNQGDSSFLQRAGDKFDFLSLLDLLPRLLTWESMSLENILHLASQLTRRWVLVEYIGPTDRAFKKLISQAENYPDRAQFEQTCSKFFTVKEFLDLTHADRSLFLLEKRV